MGTPWTVDHGGGDADSAQADLVDHRLPSSRGELIDKMTGLSVHQHTPPHRSGQCSCAARRRADEDLEVDGGTFRVISVEFHV
jgi:hypothetical protein